MRFSPESPIRDCDSIILNLRAYIRTRLQFWFSHFAENKSASQASDQEAAIDLCDAARKSHLQKSESTRKARHVGVPYPLLMVGRTECKGGKAPGKTPEAIILGQEKKTEMI